MMLVLVLPVLPMLLPLELPMMVLGLVSDVELTWATIGLRTRGWRRCAAAGALEAVGRAVSGAPRVEGGRPRLLLPKALLLTPVRLGRPAWVHPPLARFIPPRLLLLLLLLLLALVALLRDALPVRVLEPLLLERMVVLLRLLLLDHRRRAPLFHFVGRGATCLRRRSVDHSRYLGRGLEPPAREALPTAGPLLGLPFLRAPPTAGLLLLPRGASAAAARRGYGYVTLFVLRVRLLDFSVASLVLVVHGGRVRRLGLGHFGVGGYKAALDEIATYDGADWMYAHGERGTKLLAKSRCESVRMVSCARGERPRAARLNFAAAGSGGR